ncbi:hypothetical protein BGW36DRAFT_57260 [Talaromyces proteolyticus]|uniref:Uncharacterized protein n=1 Tax=Talaromyces proteolyticus TaxID=1131652 RepID=A0AAD4PUU5_9EURO|nr:uncharacterized protein BGW36DRAFT_57260 [Talaromyces proteolyticus]KAH8690549.1 hypothetical protein BGW36DRAFT_57260 [Talaromyces proteolyticus]
MLYVLCLCIQGTQISKLIMSCSRLMTTAPTTLLLSSWWFEAFGRRPDAATRVSTRTRRCFLGRKLIPPARILDVSIIIRSRGRGRSAGKNRPQTPSCHCLEAWARCFGLTMVMAIAIGHLLSRLQTRCIGKLVGRRSSSIATGAESGRAAALVDGRPKLARQRVSFTGAGTSGYTPNLVVAGQTNSSPGRGSRAASIAAGMELGWARRKIRSDSSDYHSITY